MWALRGLGYLIMIAFMPIFLMLAFIWEMHLDRNYSGLFIAIAVFVVFILIMNDWAPTYY